MDTSEIAEKVGLEPFLVKEIQDVSSDREYLKTFLEEMVENYDSLNRALVTEGARFSLNRGGLNYTDSNLEDAVIEVSGDGGIEVSETDNERFFSKIFPSIGEESKKELISIRDDAYFGNRQGAMEIKFNIEDWSKAELTANPKGNIYVVQSVDKNSAIHLRDCHFWQELAHKNGLKNQAIDPKYKGKKPVTPWYTATDKQSGAVFTMGWRWRVDEIGVDFRKPVPAEMIDRFFGHLQSTKYADGKWINKKVSYKKDFLNSFTIHSHKRDNTEKYVSRLIDIARQE